MKEIIVSRQNPLVKAVCALLEKKQRRASGLFRFDGVKLFEEAIFCGIDIEYIVVSEGANANCQEAVERALSGGKITEDKVYTVSLAVFEKISEEKAPEGVVTVAKQLFSVKENCSAADISHKERLLLAEALRDPGNLGTVIRSCAALGIDRLVLSSDCADIYNPKTIRAAMGGLFRLNISILSPDSMPETINELRKSGRRVFATALREDSVEIGKLSLVKGDCFVIGNEGHGLSGAVVSACDAPCIIPMREGSESLNASAAAAICIWETVKV